MLELRIGNEIVQGKVDFAFMKRANEKYGKVRTEKHEMNGKEHQEEVKTPGYEVIYEGLLNSNYEALLHFWDCVFASRDKIPTLEEIGTALYEKMPADGDIDDLFKEAFQALDNSGFFKRAVRAYWKKMNSILKALEAQLKTKEDEEEKAMLTQGLEQYKEMTKLREELNPEAKKKGKK
ncbi:tail chaperone protein [Bacillus phage 000TH010]|uniref:Tail assembly chaperone n=1 Tax=Bacillus phage 000TH010 TaxID=2601652 RepID=A0A5P8PHP4_9CAUD|nr:tail chaperone protein [Bacillus phage 000TH010]QFR56236.1 tail assembly chaperone [Bacillus phage 000TH010]